MGDDAVWYRGYRLIVRPPRWKARSGQLAVRVTQMRGKYPSNINLREFTFFPSRPGDMERAMAKAKIWVDGVYGEAEERKAARKEGGVG